MNITAKPKAITELYPIRTNRFTMLAAKSSMS